MKDITTRQDIELLVNTFYDNMQNNKELDVLFNDVAKINWETHLPKMYDFWESILLHNPLYKGNPMRVHIQLDQMQKLKKEDFEMWMEIFHATVDSLFEGAVAEQSKTRAMSIATSIQLNTVYKK
ncbi:MAG: group III truncated hemoglobin [Flavobacteriaceae bacterium]|nr:group III truncated hemoglobin [Flavobacteriaceae bacterium]